MGDNMNLPRMGESLEIASPHLPEGDTDVGNISQERISDEFQKDVLGGLADLRQFNRLCDVTVVVKGTTFPCHKCVLAASSGFFKTLLESQGMFCGQLAESRQDRVELHELDADTMSLMLDFMYSGRVNITQHNVEALGSAADMFQISGLRRICDDFMVQQLDLANCIGMYRFARLHNMERLARAASDMALQNFVRVMAQEEYLQLDSDSVIELLASDELNVESEDAVFRALEVWMNHDPKRYRLIDDFLEHLRLYHCTPKYLVGVIQHSPIMSGENAQKQISRAVQQHLGGSLSDLPSPRRAYPWKEVLVRVGGHRGDRLKSITVHIDSAWHKLLPQNPSTPTHTPSSSNSSSNSHLDILDGFMSCKVGNDILLFENKNGNLKPVLFDSRKPKRVTTFNSIPSRKTYFVVCECMERVYLLGGLAREVNIVSFPTVECFSLKQNQWKSLQPLPEGIFPMAAATHNENIFVFGGKILPSSCSPSKNTHISNVKSVLMYDTLSDTWSYVSEVPSPGRVGLLAVSDEQYIYIIVETNTRDSKFMRFDPRTRTWKQLANPTKTHTRGCALTMRDGQILLAGGTEGAAAELYDVASDTWNELPNMNIQDHQFGLHRILLPKDVLASLVPCIPGHYDIKKV